MIETVLKIFATSVLVVAASEASKRSILLGSILASLPLTSLLAMVWLWADTKDPEKVAALAHGIFWLILPSLTLLFALPIFLRQGWPFPVSLGLGIALTAVSYFLMVWVLKRLGVEI